MLKLRRDHVIYGCCILFVIGLIGVKCSLNYRHARALEKSLDQFAQLLDASRDGDNEKVKQLVAAGAPLEDNGLQLSVPLPQPLVFAAQNNHVDTVKLLLDAGANPKINGNGAVLEAVGGNHLEVVRLLVDRGAGLDAASYTQNRVQDTAIMLALSPRPGTFVPASANSAVEMKRRTEIVRYLIGKGDNVNARNQFGVTPLIYASLQGYTEIVNLLLENHAEIDVASNHSHTALLAAIRAGHAETIKTLISHGANLAVNPEELYYAIATSPSQGHAEVAAYLNQSGVTDKVRHLLARGVNPNYMAPAALIEAIKKGQSKTVEHLLNSGANPDASALIAALLSGNLDCAMLLLKYGPQIQVSWHGDMPDSPLMMAASVQKIAPGGASLERRPPVTVLEIIQEMVRRGADDDYRNPHGETALSRAAAAGNAEVVAALLKYNPTLMNAPDRSGMTPLCHAVRSGSEKTVQALMTSGAAVSDKKAMLNAIDFSTVHNHKQFPELRKAALQIQ